MKPYTTNSLVLPVAERKRKHTTLPFGASPKKGDGISVLQCSRWLDASTPKGVLDFLFISSYKHNGHGDAFRFVTSLSGGAMPCRDCRRIAHIHSKNMSIMLGRLSSIYIAVAIKASAVRTTELYPAIALHPRRRGSCTSEQIDEADASQRIHSESLPPFQPALKCQDNNEMAKKPYKLSHTHTRTRIHTTRVSTKRRRAERQTGYAYSESDPGLSIYGTTPPGRCEL